MHASVWAVKGVMVYEVSTSFLSDSINRKYQYPTDVSAARFKHLGCMLDSGWKFATCMDILGQLSARRLSFRFFPSLVRNPLL